MPLSAWKSTGSSTEVNVRLKERAHLDTLRLFISEDRPIHLRVDALENDQRRRIGERRDSDLWKQWLDIPLNAEAQEVVLTFEGESAAIGEIVFFSSDRVVAIESARLIGAHGAAPGPENLIDEPQTLTSAPTFRDGAYFDEIFFSRSGEEYVDGLEASEWTHPPLGKWILSAGIWLTGHHPFGWRISGVIFSLLSILLVYRIGFQMFGPRGALIAAFLLTFDFMHFSESRLGTVESFVFFFVVLLFFTFFRYFTDPEKNSRYLFLSFVCFGLGFATKWVVANTFLGILLLVVVLRREKIFHGRDFAATVLGALAAGAIYFLSFVPEIRYGSRLDEILPLQEFMFQYHSQLAEGHPFGSPWYGWPILIRPLWLVSSPLGGEKISTILLFGNPALWWGSIVAVIYAAGSAFLKKDRIALCIVIPYLTHWLPFAAVKRVMYIYHFYPNVLFMVLATTFLIQRLWTRWRNGCLAFLCANVLLFFLFYPVISGSPISMATWEKARRFLVIPVTPAGTPRPGNPKRT